MESARLRSGREVMIRPIRADDAAALRAAYDRLSPRSKYQRFLVSKPRLTEADARYLTEVDGTDHCALVAIAPEEPDRILGVGRFVRLKDDPQAAEFAVVVGDPFQGEGLGSELLDRLSESARDRGIARITATMHAENAAAHRLVRRLASRGLVRQDDAPASPIERHFGPVDEMVVELAA